MTIGRWSRRIPRRGAAPPARRHGEARPTSAAAGRIVRMRGATAIPTNAQLAAEASPRAAAGMPIARTAATAKTTHPSAAPVRRVPGTMPHARAATNRPPAARRSRPAAATPIRPVAETRMRGRRGVPPRARATGPARGRAPAARRNAPEAAVHPGATVARAARKVPAVRATAVHARAAARAGAGDRADPPAPVFSRLLCRGRGSRSFGRRPGPAWAR